MPGIIVIGESAGTLAHGFADESLAILQNGNIEDTPVGRWGAIEESVELIIRPWSAISPSQTSHGSRKKR